MSDDNHKTEVRNVFLDFCYCCFIAQEILFAKIRILLSVIFNALQQPCMRACMPCMQPCMHAACFLFWMTGYDCGEFGNHFHSSRPAVSLIFYDFYCTKEFVSFLVSYAVLTRESCSNSLEVQRRMEPASGVFGGLEGTIWQTRIALRTKLWLYDPYLVPVLI